VGVLLDRLGDPLFEPGPLFVGSGALALGGSTSQIP
jgi:hypothetical protein